MNLPDPATSLTVRRFIPAPRERVFKAFTTPEDLTKWFGGTSFPCTMAMVDPRAGGAYHLHMKKRDGSENDLRGEYLEVRTPERLVFTWGSCAPGSTNRSQVTVDFVEADGGTDIQLTHELLADRVDRDRHNYGWNICLDGIQEFLTPKEEPAVAK